MPILLWDASALAKRYAPEIGSDTVDALFDALPTGLMVATVLSYAEAFSVLLRKRNRGQISATLFATAVSSLRTEILYSPDFGVLSIEDTAVLDGIELMQMHNINSADAAILAAYLDYSRNAVRDVTCLLIASDQRMLRAANAEGLRTLNPEQTPAADISVLLAS